MTKNHRKRSKLVKITQIFCGRKVQLCIFMEERPTEFLQTINPLSISKNKKGDYVWGIKVASNKVLKVTYKSDTIVS